MSAFIDMIGVERLTIRELDALMTVIKLGMADCENLLSYPGDNGIITRRDHGSALDASQKLFNALTRAKNQLVTCEICGRSGKIPHRAQPHMGMCGTCGRIPSG